MLGANTARLTQSLPVFTSVPICLLGTGRKALGCVGRQQQPSLGAVGSQTSELVSLSPVDSPGLGAAGAAVVSHSWMRILAVLKQEAAQRPLGCLLRADTIERLLSMPTQEIPLPSCSTSQLGGMVSSRQPL